MSRGLNNPPRKVGKRKIKGTCLQGSWMVAILRTANCVEQVGQMSQFHRPSRFVISSAERDFPHIIKFT